MTYSKWMRSLWAGIVTLLCSQSVALALGIDDLDPAATTTVEQGQIFYSDTVSRIGWDGRQACMVSTGTDWKRTGIAKRARDVSASTSESTPFDAAFAAAPDVPLSELASNTPFMSFLFDDVQPTAVRIALGFAVRSGTLRLSTSDALGIEIPARVEPRGDTVIVEDPAAIETLFASFAAHKTLKIRARSRKQRGATEHIVAYDFVGQLDPKALTMCQSDIAKNAIIETGSVPSLTLHPTNTNDEMAARMRGMACNRDIDLTDAELVQISGPVLGLSTPLSHALVRRDADGAITDIVSGDLWHLTRGEQGYTLRTSRSLTAQSPMGPQIEKSCTRYSEARCATLNESADNGSIKMAECLGMFLSEAYSVGDPGWVQGPIGPLPGGTPAAGDPGPGWSAAVLPGPSVFPPVFFGTGGGGGGTGRSIGDLPERPGTGGEDIKIEVVPVPQSFAFMATALVALFAVRGTKRPNALDVGDRTT